MRVVIFGIVLPTIIAVAAAGYQLAILPQLPEPVAIHWSGSSVPDRAGPAWGIVAVTLGVVAAMPAAIFGLAAALVRKSGRSIVGHPVTRLLLTLLNATSVFVAALLTYTFHIQRNNASWDEARLGPESMVLCATLALLVAVVVWISLPRVRDEGDQDVAVQGNDDDDVDATDVEALTERMGPVRFW